MWRRRRSWSRQTSRGRGWRGSLAAAGPSCPPGSTRPPRALHTGGQTRTHVAVWRYVMLCAKYAMQPHVDHLRSHISSHLLALLRATRTHTKHSTLLLSLTLPQRAKCTTLRSLCLQSAGMRLQVASSAYRCYLSLWRGCSSFWRWFDALFSALSWNADLVAGWLKCATREWNFVIQRECWTIGGKKKQAEARACDGDNVSICCSRLAFVKVG